MQLQISANCAIPLDDIQLSAIRAQGSGGQNVNKVSSAIHLHFDIRASQLPEDVKAACLELRDHRITKEGVTVIKAQRFRTQELNREDALKRLRDLIQKATHKDKPRKATRPTRSSQKKRLDSKTIRGKTKSLRGRIDF
jgi:ribosome-associated protein